MVCGGGTEPNEVDGVAIGNTAVGIVSLRRHGHAKPSPTASTAAAAISLGLRGTTAGRSQTPERRSRDENVEAGIAGAIPLCLHRPC